MGVSLLVVLGCLASLVQPQYDAAGDGQFDSVRYQAHVEGRGWLGWVRDGVTAGTTGQDLRMEAVKIEIVRR